MKKVFRYYLQFLSGFIKGQASHKKQGVSDCTLKI